MKRYQELEFEYRTTNVKKIKNYICRTNPEFYELWGEIIEDVLTNEKYIDGAGEAYYTDGYQAGKDNTYNNTSYTVGIIAGDNHTYIWFIAWDAGQICDKKIENVENVENVEAENKEQINNIATDSEKIGETEQKMKFKTTIKALKENSVNLKCCGYCDLQFLLSNTEPVAYNCGVYGWNFDVYNIYGLTICTGYRSQPGERLKGIKEYNDKARKIVNKRGNYDQTKRDLEKLLKDFCILNGGY